MIYLRVVQATCFLCAMTAYASAATVEGSAPVIFENPTSIDVAARDDQGTVTDRAVVQILDIGGANLGVSYVAGKGEAAGGFAQATGLNDFGVPICAINDRTIGPPNVLVGTPCDSWPTRITVFAD